MPIPTQSSGRLEGGSKLLSFHLPDEFVDSFAGRPVNWGFKDAGGNSLGEITFLRTYSRTKEDGTKERWHEVCRRVVEGVQSILKDHCKTNALPWNENQARASAQEMYERMFDMKWLPPGRGLWMMGTPFVHERKNSAPLQNCAFVSTGDMTKIHPERPFLFLMEASMLGVGVGFDTDGADKGIVIHEPGDSETFDIPDSREGWVEAVGKMLRSYLVPNQPTMYYLYDRIRPAGEPIRGFGGVAAGPGPLHQLIESLRDQFEGRWGEALGSRDIVDIANLIGRCVVAGNVRRSAEIALGHHDDKEFLNLKNYVENPERAEFGWVSNNSVKVEVGKQAYDGVVDRIIDNGEPGLIYMDISRRFGRLVDPPNDKDARAKGYNPCAEQTLESYECCTLVETFPTRCENQADYMRTLKYAYMYAKAVTLIPTHWPETNAVMQRNRRIGCSASGLAQFADTRGWTDLRTWLNDGYGEIQKWDTIYSEWLGIRPSVKTTSIKPSGSVSLLAGVTPGAHYPPGGEFYIRRMRLPKNDALTQALIDAGYHVEDCVGSAETTVVVEIPVRGVPCRTEREVPVFTKVNLAILAQRYWADNSVSLTISFDKDKEAQYIGEILSMHEGQLKTMSFLPMGDSSGYTQLPYERIDESAYDEYAASGILNSLDWDTLYGGAAADALGEKFCTTDVCEIKIEATT
jgi:ribonucleoside-triphosphate reductase